MDSESEEDDSQDDGERAGDHEENEGKAETKCRHSSTIERIVILSLTRVDLLGSPGKRNTMTDKFVQR